MAIPNRHNMSALFVNKIALEEYLVNSGGQQYIICQVLFENQK